MGSRAESARELRLQRPGVERVVAEASGDLLSHLVPYKGDFSPTTERQPPPVPKPAWWCPPFLGQRFRKPSQ